MSQVIKNLASGPVPPAVATSYVTNFGTAVPALNVLNVLGGAGSSTSASGNTININVINDGFPWSDQSVSFNAIPQNGYFCTAALTVTLPTAGLVSGSTVIIYVDTALAVMIQAGAGQKIEVSTSLSSMAGSAKSTGQGNILQLVFRVSDNTWHTISSQGTFILA